MQIYRYIFTEVYTSKSDKMKLFTLSNPHIETSHNGFEFIANFLTENLNSLITICDDLSMFILIELLDYIGPSEKLFNNLSAFNHIITSHRNMIVRKKCVKFMLHCGFLGLQILLAYCEDELNPVGHLILETLIEEPLIQSCIVVPSLLNNFHEADVKTRSSSLAALSRFFSRTKGALVAEIYKNLLKENALDTSLIIGAIRSLGMEGEKLLYDILKKRCPPKIKTIIVFYLGFRIPFDQETSLTIN